MPDSNAALRKDGEKSAGLTVSDEPERQGLHEQYSTHPEIIPGAVFQGKGARYDKRVLARYFDKRYGGDVVRWERIGSLTPPEVWAITTFAERIIIKPRSDEHG